LERAFRVKSQEELAVGGDGEADRFGAKPYKLYMVTWFTARGLRDFIP